MKKAGIVISVFLVLLAGAFIFAGVFQMEKKEQQREKEAQAEKKKEEEAQNDIVGKVHVESFPEDSEEVFPQEDSTADNDLQAEDETVLLFAGDVYISRHIEANYDAGGIENVVSKDLLSEMQQADLCMVNEEFPFGTVGTPMEDKQFTFRVNPFYVSVLNDMGVDIVSLANNHVLDYGADCLVETFQTLDNSLIDYAGAGNSIEEASALRSYEFGGRTYGILAASRVIPVPEWNIQNCQPGVFTTYDETDLVAAIKAAKKTCDYLTVYVHWGKERTTELQEHQTYLAHAYVDAGADLVIGAHPHILQGIENYNGKLIFYSLGNYLFNQSIDKTMLVKVRHKNGEIGVSLLPAYAVGAKTSGYENREEFFSYLEGLSTGISIEDGEVKLQQ